VKEGVQPHSKGGVVKLNISVNYRLFKLVESHEPTVSRRSRE
jgi:hypothetical protein